MEFQLHVLKIQQLVVLVLLEALLQPQVHLKFRQLVEKLLNLIRYLLRLVLQPLATTLLNQAQLIAVVLPIKLPVLPIQFIVLPLVGLKLLPPVIQLQVGFQLVDLQLANLQLMVPVIQFIPVLLIALAKHQNSHLKRDFILRCPYFTL